MSRNGIELEGIVIMQFWINAFYVAVGFGIYDLAKTFVKILIKKRKN